MNHAYRSAYDHIVGARVAGARATHAAMTEMTPMLRVVRDTRVARILAGSIAIAGGTLMTIAAALPAVMNESVSELPTTILLASSALAAVTYAVARLGILALPFRLKEWALPPLSGDLDRDLQAIEGADPARALLARLARLETPSVAIPMCGMTMLTPLLLHWLFVAIMGSTGGYSTWIQISLVIVGHAHLALIALSVAYAKKMKRLPTPELDAMSVLQEWTKALGIVTLVAAVPGLILFAVPPILSALTGATFIPLMFIVSRRLILKERATLEMAETASPTMVRVEASDLVSAGAPLALDVSDDRRVPLASETQLAVGSGSRSAAA